MLAEANESTECTVDGLEGVSSESEISSWITICSSASDASDPEVPNRSLFIAAFAASRNHSSSGSALKNVFSAEKKLSVAVGLHERCDQSRIE